MNSTIASSSPVALSHVLPQPYRPKLYLMRHAESLAKEYNPRTKLTHTDTSLKDPKLSPHGVWQTSVLTPFLKERGINITHILSAPLSRSLDTACLALPQLIEQGVLVQARAELQTMDTDANGLGLRLQALHNKYGYEAGCARRQERQQEQSYESKLHDNCDEEPELEDDKRRTRDFRGFVDLSALSEDWNDEKHKIGEGKYAYVSDVHKRHTILREFLERLKKARMPRERLEVLVVSHSSFIYPWVADYEWDTFEICLWRFRRTHDGIPKPEGEKKRLVRLVPGVSVEQQKQAHTHENPISPPIPRLPRLSEAAERRLRHEIEKVRARRALEMMGAGDAEWMGGR